MTQFTKYMHLERFGTSSVNGIEVGTTYVFPKLDGTNASVWLGEDGEVKAGSRNRDLSVEGASDNAGFRAFAESDQAIEELLLAHPSWIVYGEWLVPHSLKTYRDDAWRRFYVFDVFDGEKFLTYDEYKPAMDQFGLDYLAPIAIVKNGNHEIYQGCLDRNTFLIQDGKGVGEGIVIKNYDFVNRWGNVVWAKIITNAFKEEAHKVMGSPLVGQQTVEEKIVDTYVTDHLVQKTFAKLSNEEDGWHQRKIPQLLGMVWHDLITEEIWEAIKKFKNPKIDFGNLNRLCKMKTKQALPEVF
jgi:hypothetical protein